MHGPEKRGPYRKDAALLMSAFKIARSCLLLSGLFYLSALVLGIIEVIGPGLTIVATAFASLALAISAVACVILQIWGWFRGSQPSENLN
jgi:hypothetical protein